VKFGNTFPKSQNSRSDLAGQALLVGLDCCSWFGQVFGSLHDNDRCQQDEKAH
jgi:hypothetical protein